MSDPVQPTHPETETVSPETRALVERSLPGESDEVQYHAMALIEAIKKRAETQMQATGDMTRENYISAMRQAQSTLETTGSFFTEQRHTLATTLSQIEDQANKNWETLISDVQKVGNRIDRAINAAWQVLTESDASKSSASSDDSEPPAA